MKKTVGFPISYKENENRRALMPKDAKNIANAGQIYVETGYGDVLGIDDQEYINAGFHVASHNEILKKDIICDAKIGDEPFLADLNPGQVVFGWVHAVQNRDITDILVNNKLTAYAWEDMFESGRHVFYRNNELAGEAAVMHAFQCWGEMPYNCKVALLGRGNVSRGALKLLSMLGAEIIVYDRKTEKLFRQEIGQFDVVVNAVLWDTHRKDHILYKEDLKRMKKGALIIDISCDKNGGIETSIPTTIEDPVYIEEGIMHYVVDHTPALFYKTVSESLSYECTKYIDYLITGDSSEVLKECLIIENGIIKDQRINEFQHRQA